METHPVSNVILGSGGHQLSVELQEVPFYLTHRDQDKIAAILQRTFSLLIWKLLYFDSYLIKICFQVSIRE